MQKVVQKKENPFEDLKKYYDLTIARTKDFERLLLGEELDQKTMQI